MAGVCTPAVDEYTSAVAPKKSGEPANGGRSVSNHARVNAKGIAMRFKFSSHPVQATFRANEPLELLEDDDDPKSWIASLKGVGIGAENAERTAYVAFKHRHPSAPRSGSLRRKKARVRRSKS